LAAKDGRSSSTAAVSQSSRDRWIVGRVIRAPIRQTLENSRPKDSTVLLARGNRVALAATGQAQRAARRGIWTR
jgi:hypothetical protein